MLTISDSRSNPVPAGVLPPRLDTQELRGFERVAVAVCDAINLYRPVKSVVQYFVGRVTSTWISLVTGNLWDLRGLEHVRDLRPPQGVILVSNHRSFFDMYVTCAVLYKRARFLKRIHFPVRTHYFYTNPVGLLVNLLVSGGAMWPPVFRDERRFRLNPTGIAQMVHVLEHPGSLIGIHPEGTRNKGDDPHTLAPAKAGVGHLVKAAHPETLVVPFFIMGMSNNVVAEVRRNFRPPGRRGPPIRITFGEPVRCGELDQEAPAQDLADEVRRRITVLAEEDRARPVSPR